MAPGTVTRERAQFKITPELLAFIAVWLGQVVSVLGSGLTGFVLGIWVYQQTGSVTLFALITAFAVVPGIIVSPFAGALIDRWDRRWVMILSNTLSGLNILAVAWLLSADRLEIWHIYAITVVGALCGAFLQLAFSASTTLLVPKEHYGRASGMVQMGIAVAQIISPVLAGILVIAIGVAATLLIDFASFVFAVVTLLLIRIPKPPATSEGTAGQGLLLRDATFGWKYITARRGLLALLLFFALTNITVGIIQILITPLVLSFATPDILGRVLSTGGIGMLLGGVVMSIWGGPKRRVLGIFGFALLQGVVLILGELGQSALLLSIAAAFFLFSAMIINGCSQAIWQSKVAPDVQGRVFSIRIMIAWSTLPVAYLVAGPLADYIFNPLLVAGGPLAGSLGQLFGTGPSRGIGLLFSLLGMLVILAVTGGYLYPRLRFVDTELPDAQPDAAGPTPQAQADFADQAVQQQAV